VGDDLIAGVVDGARGIPERVRFENAEALRCDFSAQSFFSYTAVDSTFTECSFAGARFAYATLGGRRTTYERCDFRGADLRGIYPGDASFLSCEFTDAQIKGWMSFCAEFVDCRFATRIIDSIFSASPRSCLSGRTRHQFRGNDFSEGELLDTMFIGGIDLNDQRWPTSDDYVRIPDAAARLANASKAIDQWPEPGRTEAQVEVRFLARFAEDQDELIVRRDDLDIDAETAARLWRVLAP
jgi:fluoroquinolone resistance protein